MGPDGIHLGVLKELPDVMAGPFLIKGPGSPGKVPAGGRYSIYKKGCEGRPRELQTFSSTSVPGKIMNKIIPSTTERHLRNNAIIRHSNCGFTGKILSSVFMF